MSEATSESHSSLLDENNPPSLRHSSVDLARPSQSKMLSLHDGFALLVSLQVGSGIFSSPSQVDNHTPSPGMSLVVWLASGLIAWAGATCFAELGAAIPVNGGMQEYLQYIYGDFLAFLASWIWILAVKPSSMAVLSIIFAQYWTNAILPPSSSHTSWVNNVLALVALTIMILLNALSLNTTTRMTNYFLWLKLGTVVLLLLCCILSVALGLHLGAAESNQDWLDRNWFSSSQTTSANQPVDWDDLSTWSLFGEYTTALYAGLWAFAGWDNANMVAGEMQNPSKDLPYAIHTALPTVILCFLLANISYYLAIPWTEIGSNNTIAVKVGERVLGQPGAFLFAFLVSLVCLGSININVFTTSRLTTAASKTGYLPIALEEIGLGAFGPVGKALQPTNSRLWQTPIKAMLFNAICTSIYIILGSFGALVTFIGIAEFLFFQCWQHRHRIGR
jgi:solute carrier family 7 (L-type amino acid transporter), member 9/15